MYNKLISSILAFALLIQIVGCYSYQEITKEEFSQTEEYSDLRVRTTNQNTYEFDENDYTVKKDSIYGSGKLKSKSGVKVNEDYTGSVYLGDIESFKFDRFSPTSTIIGIVIVGGIIALLVSSMDLGVKGSYLKFWNKFKLIFN